MEVEFKDPVATGLTFGRLLPELVTVYEEREAARFGLYNWGEWTDLGYRERSDVVAHYRMVHLVESHIQEAISDKLKAQARKNR